MVRSLHCLVSGRVQGVGYRSFVLDHARGLGLTGWTRNLPDGRVEVLAQGSDEALDEFARRLRKGPSWARVDAVDASMEPREETYENFQVRR